MKLQTNRRPRAVLVTVCLALITAGIDDEAHGLFGTLTPLPRGNQHEEEDDEGEDNN